jgi:hypothetical protein
MEKCSFVTGALLGASAMCLLDPISGGRRRAVTRDKLMRAARQTREGMDAAACDIRNRASGLAAEARAKMQTDQPADDVLASRVRAALGRVVSHPASIDVSAEHGRVVLSGPILTIEVPRLLRTVERVRGVCEVENRLDVHPTAGDVPGLQGEPSRSRTDLLASGWSPTVKVAAGVACAAVAAATIGRSIRTAA